MCDPLSAMLAISATQPVVGYVSGNANADAQEDIAQRNLDAKQKAENDKATAEASQIAKEARAKRARAAVIAEEAGIGGNLVDTIDQTIQMEAANSQGTVGLNLRRGMDNAGLQYASDIGQIKRPSLLGLGLDIGGSVAGYNSRLPKD